MEEHLSHLSIVSPVSSAGRVVELREPPRVDELVGESPALAALMRQVHAVAKTGSTVLIQGETGTGKELIARAVHRGSAHSSGPFVKINCAAIPAGLLESELMGHEKGAFTGAVSRRVGRFEQAHGGTIFLDEIGELALELQPKLLRLLQEGEFERVGGSQTLHANVRVIAATNRDLQTMVGERTFREDLFYRLSVFPLQVPPLRERRDDIPRLLAHFLRVFATRTEREVAQFSDEVMQRLVAYDWPGNIRELQNVVERSVILAEGAIIEADDTRLLADRQGAVDQEVVLAPDAEVLDPQAFIREHLRADPNELYATTHDRLDRLLFSLVLEHSQGNLRTAARVLGISRQTLRVKLRALGLRVTRTVDARPRARERREDGEPQLRA